MANDELFEFDHAVPELTLSRRRFLAATGSGIVLFFTIGDMPSLAQRSGRSLPSDFNAFLRIGEDGRVSCFTGKIEMGQGVITGLAQMLAEELDLPIGSVDMVLGDTELCPYDMGTFGSMSTRFFGPALRSAGAEARAVLVELAAKELKTTENNLRTEGGVVFDAADKKKQITYAALARGKNLQRFAGGKVEVKKPSAFSIIGKPIGRQDALSKVTGKALYAADIRLPGMLYAKILRPPAHGAKLLNVDLAGAKSIAGVQVVHEGDFVAVLHKYPDVAEAALAKVKAEFSAPAQTPDDKSIFDHLLKVAPAGSVVNSDGDTEAAKGKSTKTFSETYLNDYVAHSPIEPHAALVAIEGKKATVWASTQTPFPARDEVAKELGLEPAHVRVMPVFVGGAFGGKNRNLQVVEAARLAKITGKPVQVAWTRDEEFFYDAYRPAAVVKIESGIGANGGMSFWDYHVYFAGDRGAEQFYTIPASRTTSHNSSWVGPEGAHPFATGPWRAPGNNTNTFARESQIDLMAAAAGVDPLEYRLRHLDDPKMIGVLRAASAKFGWTSHAASSGKGYGVACGIDAGTIIATMAEVAVDRATGAVKVKRVVAAQDMGLCINPEAAALQMEGCIMMGLGYSLTEGLHFSGGNIHDRNFDSYEIPRFSWMPEIETVIVDDKDAAPQGGGEPAVVTMGAAIANAIYDAAGIRLFHLPMTADRIKEALQKK